MLRYGAVLRALQVLGLGGKWDGGINERSVGPPQTQTLFTPRQHLRSAGLVPLGTWANLMASRSPPPPAPTLCSGIPVREQGAGGVDQKAPGGLALPIRETSHCSGMR